MGFDRTQFDGALAEVGNDTETPPKAAKLDCGVLSSVCDRSPLSSLDTRAWDTPIRDSGRLPLIRRQLAGMDRNRPVLAGVVGRPITL